MLIGPSLLLCWIWIGVVSAWRLSHAHQLLRSHAASRSFTLFNGINDMMPPIGVGNDFADMGPPPDLPSLLLHNRVIYIGTPLVPQLTELVIAQLLYLNHMSNDMITLYINSQGTNAPDGKLVSFDSEAFAIADTMQFIRPPIRTICVGTAYGTAAMLLGLGQKGHRCALPNASIMLSQPRTRASGQANEVAIKARELAVGRRTTNELIAQACGKDIAEVEKDASRTKYLSAQEAVDYGLIDHVLQPESAPFKGGSTGTRKLWDLL